MKFKGIPGEFAFRALVKCVSKWEGQEEMFFGWELSDNYFFTKEEAELASHGKEIKWPVRVDADGYCYVIDPSKYEEEQ